MNEVFLGVEKLEIAVYFLAVMLMLLSFSLYFIIHKMKREREKSKKLSALINASQVYTITWTTDFSKIEANKKLSDFLGTLGRTADENFLKLLFLDNDNTLGTTGSVLLMGALNKSGRKTAFALPDGTIKHILWKSKIISSEENFTSIATTGTDITEEHDIREQLNITTRKHESAKDSLDATAENADIGVFTLNHTASGYELEISSKSSEMLGLKEDEVSISALYDRISQEDKELLVETLHAISTGESNHANIEADVKISEDNTHRFVFKIKSTGNRSGNTHRITVAFIDMTNEQENIRLGSSSDDPLTGFLNRNGFFGNGESFLEKANKDNRKIAVIALKLKRFQKISTLFGIEIADKLLTVYARGIENCSGKPSLLGKMNLDSFAAIISCESKEEAELFASRLTDHIADSCNDTVLPAVLKEQAGFTIGVCFYDGLDDVVTFYNKANMMIYTDYSEKDYICRYFDKTIEERIYNRELIEQELHDAIKNNEFELYYQPKMSFDNSEITGMEALIRWNHPSNGVITPTSFIPIAEESGIITKIDEWGLAEACHQTKKWQDMGYKPLRISVNISQMQLYRTDIVSTIKNALSESGLDAKYLEIELTETMAMQDIDRTISILKEIQNIGVSISMDDFGTGYSSLSALKLLPINILKIDRSLITDISTNSTSYSIVKAIVELGNALELEVLAEGVETEVQSDILSHLGCTVAQGFFYGRPLSAKEIEKNFLEPLTPVE